MSEKKTGLFENGLIWFGAAVSIAEIITGTYLAPLGFSRGMAAIIVGHILGCILLFLSGVIGGSVGKSAMESVKLSFGSRGGLLFSLLNILQLVGWTGIMIYDGAVAAAGLWSVSQNFWCIVIGVLIVLWILIGIKNLGKLNTIVMAALFILTIAMSIPVFSGKGGSVISAESMSFGAALELSVAMPLSWLPLISDYTSQAEKPVKASAVSAIVYGLVSCWMYAIGMGAAIFTGESDIAQLLLKVGLGAAGLVIVVLSTVTTTFLDAWSAGISSEALSSKLSGKWIAVGTAVIGMLGAILLPLGNITNFLYFIGSVFAPMIAIQIAQHFILHKESISNYNIVNLCVWALGFIIYRLLMGVDIVIGSTVPDIVITIILCVAANKLFTKKAVREK